VQADGKVAQVDDRDVAQLMSLLEQDGRPLDDEALLAWLDGGGAAPTLHYRQQQLALQRIGQDAVAAHFHFTRLPLPP
jgi:streptomycin 6-kinase